MFKQKLALTKKHAIRNEVDYLRESIIKQLEKDLHNAQEAQERQGEIKTQSQGLTPTKHKNKSQRGSQTPKTIYKDTLPEWIVEQEKKTQELEEKRRKEREKNKPTEEEKRERLNFLLKALGEDKEGGPHV